MPDVIGEITAAGDQIALFGAGSPEELAYDTALLATMTPLIKPVEGMPAMIMPLSWPAVVQLSELYGPRWKPQPALVDWTRRQMWLREAPVEPLRSPPPPHLTPYPWQVDGAHIIATHGRAMICDDPGTGKTITAILGIREWIARRGDLYGGQGLPVVCMVPASTVVPWVRAWREWCPELSVVAYRGDRARRKRLLGSAAVYVASADMVRTDAQTKDGPLAKLGPYALILDECHQCKNPKARRTVAMNRLARGAQLFIGMSGTPIAHNSSDTWPTLAHVQPVAWPAKERWVKRYCLYIPGDYSSQVIGLNKHAEPEFRMAMRGQLRRIAKDDALELPDKIYSIRPVLIPPDHLRAYKAFEADMSAVLEDGQELSAMSVLAQLTHLSVLSCSAADVEIELLYDKEVQADGTVIEVPRLDEETGEQKTAAHVHPRLPCWKGDTLVEILNERPAESVVCFASSKQLLMLAGSQAQDAGRRVGYIVGGQSQTQRTAVIDKFQAGELDLIMATTQAGGVGITLTAASTVVFLQRPWSIVDALQAEDRAHRIGSERHPHIEIIDVVAENTIDARVREVLKEKGGSLAEFVNDPRIVAQLLGGISLTRKAS